TSRAASRMQNAKMLTRIFRSAIVASVLVSLTTGWAAMGPPKQASSPEVRASQTAPAVSTLIRPLPFGPGEVLTYNIGFSKLVFSGSIGQLKLTVKKNEPEKSSAPGPGSTTRQEKEGSTKETARPEAAAPNTRAEPSGTGEKAPAAPPTTIE